MSPSALPTLLAIPPINLLLAAGLGATLGRRRGGRVLLAVGLGGLLLFSLPIVAGTLIAILENGLAAIPPPSEPPQAVVILSGDQQRVWEGDRIGWRVGRLTLEREASGAELARLTHLPLLVSGGVIRDGAPSLAAQMTRSLEQDFASPVRWREDRSKDTWQNAVLSTAMLKAAGIQRVYLVTHAWHMRRALLAFRRAGLVATPAPVQIDAEPEFSIGAFVPSTRAWQESYYAVHEMIGWAWYAIKA